MTIDTFGARTLMIILVGILIGLGLIVAMCTVLTRRSGEKEQPVLNAPSCATCDGSPATRCEQECMMEAATKEIEYYDDEELDAFRGREAHEYSDEEAEDFREVLYTMRQDDVAGWNRSLVLRGIHLPNQVKDEVVMMMGG